MLVARAIGLRLAIPQIQHFALVAMVGCEAAADDRGAHLVHELAVKVQIVLGQKMPTQAFASFGQVMQVSPGIGAAGVAATLRVDGVIVHLIGSAAQAP